MISLKFKTLFPIRFSIRKYGLIWKRVGFCCGMAHYQPQVYLMMRFAFSDEYYWRCPQCGKLHGIRLISHTVPFYTKEMKSENDMLVK